jgi:putative PIN family toxin of toxin-antitoxin system
LRAILDANILVSAVLSRTDAPARLVELWLDGAFELVVSELLLEEVERTLASPRLAARIDAGDAGRLVALLRAQGELVPDPNGEPPLRSADPDDDYLLALAAAERAPIATGDRHLLALADVAPVLTARELLDALA